jgi:hypothetical protein
MINGDFSELKLFDSEEKDRQHFLLKCDEECNRYDVQHTSTLLKTEQADSV